MSQAEYTKRLDRTSDFGTYHPADQGRHYNQDGLDFDHEGKLVEAFLTEEQKKKFLKKPTPPKPVAKPQGNAAGGAAGTDAGADGANEGGQDGGGEPQGDGGPNLEMWLRGQEDYPFPDVQKAVKARYSTWKTGKRDLVQFLVDEKVVAQDDLSDELKAMIA